MRTLWQDVRYGLKMLARSPGFTFAAVLSIALGIGVNTTIFSFINGVLFRPLPFPDAQQLVRVWDGNSSSYPAYVVYRDESKVFAGLTAYSQRPLSLNTGGETERVYGEIVTGNYFDVLGAKPAIGRGFLAEEDRTVGTHPVVVLSNGLWRRRFEADPNVVGKSVNLNNHSYTIVGVMPENFAGATLISPPDLWVPMMMEPLAQPGSQSLTSPDSGWLMLLGRLKPDAGLDEAQAAVETIAGRLRRERRERQSGPEEQGRPDATVVPARGLMTSPEGRNVVAFVVGLLMTVVSLVLLVACANVANMLLARAANRRKEIAVRLALGAGRWRIVRQMLTESLLLALAGGAAGFLLTLWGTDLLLNLLSQSLTGTSVAPDVSPDVRVFSYTLLLSLLTGVVFGLVPALQASKPDVLSALKDEAATVTGAGRRKISLRNLLVVSQVAVSLLLLVAAGLFIRNLRNTQHAEPGFALENILMASFDLQLEGYDAARGRVFQEQLLERVRALPEVRAASLAEFVPLGGGVNTTPLYFEGEPDAESFNEDTALLHSAVSPDYFKTMGIAIVRGREFNQQDTASSPRVIIVNETLARRIAPDGNPLGKRLRMDSKGDYLEVVGVARDIKY
nr:ABC transporter permease [Acidobacteriota bacterium]